MNQIRIVECLIGEGQHCFFVAEIGINHNGDVELAKKTINAAVYGERCSRVADWIHLASK